MSQNDSAETSEGQALGPISSHERRVLGVFVVTALAWITRKEPFGGWSEFLGITTMGDDSVALAAALAFSLFRPTLDRHRSFSIGRPPKAFRGDS